MIAKPTLLILGAGASAPYGLPTAFTLKKAICEQLGVNTSELTRQLVSVGFDGDAIQTFRSELAMSLRKSVDRFLERCANRIEIGKAAIAAYLLGCERHAKLYDPANDDNWVEHVFEAMDAPLVEIAANDIRFVTYNYDRSLEEMLFNAIKHGDSGVTDDQAAKVLRRLMIVHLHGTLSPHPAFDPKGLPFGSAPTADNIRRAAEHIEIVHQVDPQSKNFQAAKDAIRWARRIIFLGFGFDAINVNRLKLFAPDSISSLPSYDEILGTAVDLEDTDRAQIGKLFGKIIHLGGGNIKSLRFLRQRVWLDEEYDWNPD